MKIGLIGFPGCGKSTVFRLLTGREAPAGDRKRTPLGSAAVPDPRVDVLADLYRPQKTTYATLSVVEIPGLIPTQARGAGSAAGHLKGLDPKEFLDALRDVDALVHVVRAFPDPTVPHILGDIDPVRDAELLHAELLLIDWQLVQTRLERLAQAKKRHPHHDQEVAVLTRLGAELEAGTPVHALALSEEERAVLRAYTFFTAKPLIVALNLSAEALTSPDGAERRARLQQAVGEHTPVIELAAQVEAEILELEPADRAPFMEELGLTEPGIQRLARAAYARLGFISFFTVGEDEVRAWTIRRGATAQEAAGAIHSDIARGFIRAEVADYDALVAAGGWNALKERGGIRLEGKEYLVKDGDVMSFRFNV